MKRSVCTDEHTSFSPTITCTTPGTLSISYSANTGKYTRIGNVLFYTLRIVTSTVTLGTATGDLRIALPMTVASGVINTTVGAVSMSGFDLTGVPANLVFNPVAGTEYGTLLTLLDNAAFANQPIGGLASGDTIIASGFYYTS